MTTAISPLKRKGRFSQLPLQIHKKKKLDPPSVPDDVTIEQYASRVSALLPGCRDKLHLAVPFADFGSLVDIKAELQSHKEQLRGVPEMKADLEEIQDEKLEMYISNAFIQFARQASKRLKADFKNDMAKGKIQLKTKQLDTLNVPKKSRSHLHDLDELIKSRNERAHETEVAFAKLLSKPRYREDGSFEFWKDLFPLVYGDTIENLAQQTRFGFNVLARTPNPTQQS